MSRHHPYATPYDAPPRRGDFSGPGPDRSHRYDGRPPRGRGFGGRGRGRASYGGGYDAGGHSAYDQAPPQGEPYYDSGPSQDYYQTVPYGASSQYPPGEHSQSNYGYEGPGYDNAPGSRPPRRGPRRERDDKVHDSIIEERIQRERPCRTLFIRNIKYETNSDEVRRQFEEHGQIKTFFDLIANRGMVFVTFYDLRAAERARERLQGSEISGRPIDVHYSLPRDDSQKGGTQNQEMQGALLVTLRNSPSGQPIDEGEVRRKFQQFGDVKSVRPAGDRPDQCYVEFFDIRSAEEAYGRLRHQSLQDGTVDIMLAWDETANPVPHSGGGGGQDYDDRGFRGGRGRGRGRGRGGYGGGGGYDDDRRGGSDGGGYWEEDRDRPPPRRYKEEYRGGGRGGRGSYGGDRFDSRNGGGYGGGDGYGPPPGPGGPYGGPPPMAPPPVDERLDQARKVQQLLAALKQPQGGPGGPPSSGPPHGGPPGPGYYSTPPNSAGPGGMPPYGSGPPPVPGGYPSMLPGPGHPPSNGATPLPGGPPNSQALSGLPPNLLALLQNAQAAQHPGSSGPSHAQGMPPPPSSMGGGPPGPGGYGMPPPGGGPGDLLEVVGIGWVLISSLVECCEEELKVVI
ncbi:uncharacterized protein STEHIDRAFT_130101 [Stereum hirsutum FP-91666 SS1]|uniref:uncharacterized protein n=1 Tax=Stereum hirsutum (strain FP-91666) TaxID=721885 RepID=UPI000440D2E5|nr:uncharacterized protein STEHIDRAFT_130101 [Stereum hirsutum FP-91666 SS1]EIM88137.1 hypothetical protein STEHIDRAFT_130101 [Stereum hirsutum FP-91666 SS1]